MIVAIVISAYVLSVLLAARKLVLMEHKMHPMFDNVHSNDYGWMIAGYSLFWPVVLVYRGIAWFLMGGVRKHEAEKTDLEEKIKEARSLYALAKDDNERRIILNLLESRQAELRQMKGW